jgi:hypothetical protein
VWKNSCGLPNDCEKGQTKSVTECAGQSPRIARFAVRETLVREAQLFFAEKLVKLGNAAQCGVLSGLNEHKPLIFAMRR